MDFKLFVDAILSGTPLAILAALVGLVWQAFYVHSRDKLHDGQARRELELEQHRFEHQKALETLKFEYEQRRWREQLARDITTRLVEARLAEYSTVWSDLETVTFSQKLRGALTPEKTKELAQKIKSWRYSNGGLLAEETTLEAAYVFQKALWFYGEIPDQQMEQARRVFREALRADIGLGEDVTGATIYEATERRQKIRAELRGLQSKLGISPQTEGDQFVLPDKG
jgi:hypothetical protein